MLEGERAERRKEEETINTIDHQGKGEHRYALCEESP